MTRFCTCTLLSLFIFSISSVWAVPPVVNYAGQVRVAGQPFTGVGYLKFAFVNAGGSTTYWSHDGTSLAGSEPTGELSVQVRGGLYSILLGNDAIAGMAPIDLSLFQQYNDVHIRVWFSDGERGFQHLRPDRPFASVPYALSAGTAGSAGIAPGAVSLNMLSSDVQTSLSSTIDRSRLSSEVRADLNRTVRLADLSPAVLGEINATIDRARLSADVRADLNKTIVITRDMLPADVRNDLNRTITLSDLAPEVVADLNDSVGPGTITTELLNEQILKYLRPEVVRSPQLPQNRKKVYIGQSVTLSADAEGKYLTYQWLRNGQEISGATNKEFTISDANATSHNGNYSVRISNDFGNVSTTSVQLDVNDTQLIHEADLNASVSMEMIWVEPGSFMMGQDGVATPEHNVTLTNGFYLGKYEVTQAQYEAVMTGNSDGLSATPSNWPNNADRPVEKVSWDDIQKFLTRLNAQESGNIPAGWAYVLPTEAQWEYACRAGTTTAYSWGVDINSSNANYNSNIGQTADVGQYAANPWGFFDMHGNVREWTADRYAAYSSGAQTDPEGSASGSHRVVRGGSWSRAGTSLRSASRGDYPSSRGNSIGFRVGFQQLAADVASPEMSILGDVNITQLQGVAWVDPGVEAHDVRDGNLTSSVSVSGTVDVNATGTNTLTYTVSDVAGNQASLTRTVTVGTPATYASDLNASVALEMIWVQPGSFMMGSPTTEAGRSTVTDRETEHNVTLTNGFYLGKYEVTQAQYEAVMTGNSDGLSATPSNWPNNADRPVEKVSWDDIQKFLTRLNAQESGNIPSGWSYVLPTDAQWEYACRAGTTTAYSWGDSITADNANYNSSGYSQTRDVGLYDANPWGFFDMHGNVNEWTADWYGGYSSGAQTDPEGSAAGSGRVLRGGSWLYTGTSLRSAFRLSFIPSNRYSYIGFRVGFQEQSADVASPEMSILGDANITQLQGVAWVDPGVEAHDVRDGHLTSSISVSGTVDVNTTGTYTLTYTVSDAAGNQASLTRTVTVGTPATYASDLNASVALEMIWVQPGSFMMGQSNISNASPEHNVTLTKGFYLGKYEVTQAQYEAVMTGNSDGLSATPSNWPNNADRPVEKVSWDDIQKFLTRLNAQESGNIPAGWSYVLPTEAQWEYACRAGTTTAYSWGDNISASDANWNHGNDANQTENVGQYSANSWGFFDMHGNVWEWTADRYAAYSSGAQTDPEGSATGSDRVFRGGSWGNTGTSLRSAFRVNSGPGFRVNDIGFRVGFQQQSADVASPEMSIFGDANITQLQGVAWVDPGVEAHDVRDGHLTSSVSVSGTVDVNATGTYTLTYTVSDAAGNNASLTRTVNIVAGQASTHTADLNASVSMEMIWVQPGSFTMGQSDISDASPEHNVTLTNGFYLGKYEVTQAQYEAVMTGNSDGLSATPSNWPNNADRPVEKVSWDDIQKFLTRLNAQEAGNIPAGWAYVLPTEAQWEYACRAGTTTAYSWGVDINSSRANYNWDGAYNTGIDFKQTRDVGQYSANPWGFFDMHGNVWEWTADWYGGYSSGAQTDPEGSASGSYRVDRGGSWRSTGTSLRSAFRGNLDSPSSRYNHIGFRVGFQQLAADVASPEMSILGDANITQLQGVAWVDPGVEAHDVWDGNLTSSVSVSGTVDVNTTGTYTLTYTVSDAAGNNASLTRTVNIVAGQASTHTADLNASVAVEMIWVQPGSFMMGQDGVATPEHNVTLTNGFYLGKYEVTQAQYEAVMTGNSDGLSATPSQYGGNADRPVETVSHDDIQKFLTRLNAQESGNIPAGWSYVLPTEAQWEYACRAGTTTAYSWGDDINSSNANYNYNIGQTADVGQYSANPWGFFDMHGNVYEWTADWYGGYSSGAQTDPEGSAAGSSRVFRGGSWDRPGTFLRSAFRSNNGPSSRSSSIGFRVGFQQQ